MCMPACDRQRLEGIVRAAREGNRWETRQQHNVELVKRRLSLTLRKKQDVRAAREP